MWSRVRGLGEMCAGLGGYKAQIATRLFVCELLWLLV